jgi:hypothetical protein
LSEKLAIQEAKTIKQDQAIVELRAKTELAEAMKKLTHDLLLLSPYSSKGSLQQVLLLLWP